MINKRHDIVYGISFSTYLHNSISELKAYNGEAKLIEIPCYNFDYLEKVITECQNRGFSFSLHYPSYDSFNATGYDLSQYSKTLKNLLEYQNYTKQSEYVVIHFPGDQESVPTNDGIRGSLSSVLEITQNFECPILIENISKYASFRNAVQYASLLNDSSIDLCLDIGHAHLVSSNSTYDFFEILKNKIFAIHYYNTCNLAGNQLYGVHLPPDYIADKNIETYINFNYINQYINSLPKLKYIINEYRRKSL